MAALARSLTSPTIGRRASAARRAAPLTRTRTRPLRPPRVGTAFASSDGAPASSSSSSSPSSPSSDARELLKLLRANAIVELTGAVAVALNPAAVFPGIETAAFAAVECSRWYALSMACLGAFYTLVPIRPRSRGERRSLRTFPGVSLRPPPAFNLRPRRRSTPPDDAFELHPDIIARMERPSALASFLASRADTTDDAAVASSATPVVGGMLSYHLGVSCFQVQRLTATGAAATKAVAAGALFVHAPLTIAFGVAAAWCAARVNLS